ncbi:DUF554 domain-containing protein [Candidatus Bathyarchaeota archaeon]|jgi:hypothetical protein|nr:DUF554 domain-containing protein [Candidatus Bathyarchaeota archaeon]
MLLGTVVNVAAIAIGTLIGLALKQRLPERITSIVMQGLGLVTALIGVKMIIVTENVLVVLVSIVVGGVFGELLHIEARLDAFGAKVEAKFSREKGTFAKAFVTSSLLYCVGPMAILGALQDGLRGDYSILLTKSGLDGVASVAFASTLGVGVLFSAIPLALYQGGITVGASMLEPFLSSSIVNAMTATGGLLILGIALNILQVTKIRVGNLLPAILIAAALASLLP